MKFHVLSAMLLFGFGVCAADLTIARRGVPSEYVIVIAQTPRPAERYAAEEFRDHVKRQTGTELRIVGDTGVLPDKAVLIGESASASSLLERREKGGSDGFEIAARGEHLVIRGFSPRGTLYGVYEVLERFGGCAWFATFFEDIPSRDDFSVPAGFSDREEPTYELREALWYDAYHPNVPGSQDFAARLRLNGSYHRPEAKHGGNAWRFSTRLWNGHTYYWLADPEKYFDAHPDWFSEVNGKRLKEKTQLCLTNPDLLAFAISNTLRAVALEPQAKVFCISHMDWNNWCECPRCKAIDDEEESHMGTKLRFVNAIAEVMAREHPDKLIHTEAYTYALKPPKFTRPRKNVQIAICPLDSDFSLPLNDPTVEKHRRFMSILNGWLKLDAQFYVWHYASNFGNYPAPYQNKTALPADLRMFADRGIRRMFVQGAYQGHHAGFAELDLWVVSKLLWNPRQPLEPLYDRFLAGYYGAAAPVVRKSLKLLNELERDHRRNPLTAFEYLDPAVYTAAFVEAQQNLWREAAQCVKGDAKREYNVRMSAYAFDYLRFVRDWPHVRAVRQLDFNDVPDRDGSVRRFRELAKSMVARMDERCMRLCEKTVENTVRERRLRETVHYQVRPATDGKAQAGGDSFWFKAEDGRCTIVDDPEATGGLGLLVKAGYNEWPARLMSEDIACAPGSKFRVRLRIKPNKAIASPSGSFKVGLYDKMAGRTISGKTIDVAGLSADWSWIDFGEWSVAPHQFVFLSNPSTIPIVVGTVELMRLSGQDGNGVHATNIQKKE